LVTTSNRRLLVTGASGFVGRHVLAQLSAADWELHAARRTALTTETIGIHWHSCDLRDPREAERLIDRVRPTHVLSLAWNAEHGAYWTAPDNDDWAEGTIALARATARLGGRRFVGAGTCAEYDWTALTTVCEEDRTPCRPNSIYGRAKLRACEGIAAVARESGLSTAWGRLFFLYGPGEDPNRLVPAVARALRAGERAKVTEGRQVRDFLHVTDAARAFVALLTSDVDGAVNIGSGIGVSLRHLVETLERASGRREAVDFGAIPSRPDEPPSIVADITKLKTTGWRQQVSLDQGLAQAVDGGT
jgi:nucleoside-diphosphate-sugar epimerase